MNKEQYNQASEEEREKSLEPNECRIGNWVKTKDGSERTIVNGWELDEGEELTFNP